jgi:hypothetical protein
VLTDIWTWHLTHLEGHPRLISARYFDLVREMKDACNHRLRLLESAKRIGIKPTARLFVTTVPTVRKWLRRSEQRGPSGLLPLSRARHHQSQKTPGKDRSATGGTS